MGALSPGIFKLGYEGGGPYLCMAMSHGGGTRLLPYKKHNWSIGNGGHLNNGIMGEWMWT